MKDDYDFSKANLNPYVKDLRNIEDAIVENIINTPDNEILEEVKEEYNNK